MKLIYECVYCKVNIFDTKNDLCDVSHKKHTWRIENIKENNKNIENHNVISI